MNIIPVISPQMLWMFMLTLLALLLLPFSIGLAVGYVVYCAIPSRSVALIMVRTILFVFITAIVLYIGIPWILILLL